MEEVTDSRENVSQCLYHEDSELAERKFENMADQGDHCLSDMLVFCLFVCFYNVYKI